MGIDQNVFGLAGQNWKHGQIRSVERFEFAVFRLKEAARFLYFAPWPAIPEE
jgi:hypothetical protein